MDTDHLSLRDAPFLFLSNHPKDYFKKMSADLNHPGKLGDDTLFRNTFISQENVAYVNNKIKRKVYENSCNKYIIPDQNYQHMLLIMSQIYDDYATHINDKKKEELNMLNEITIDFCSKTIVAEITHKLRYLKKVYSKPTAMPDPINTSIKGTRSFAPSFDLNEESYDFRKQIKDVDVYSRSISNLNTSVEDFCGRSPHFY